VAARHHGDVEAQRCIDRVRFVAHRVHTRDRRTDEVDTVAAAEFGELRILRQEADAGVQGVHTFVFRDAQYAHRIQVTLIGRIAADTYDAVSFRQHVDSDGFHVRVRLHEHHFDCVALRNANEFHRSAAARVNEDTLDWANQFTIPELRPSAREL